MSFSDKIAPNRTKRNRIDEIFFEIDSKDFENIVKYLLHNIPIITGTVTIKNILIAISKIDIDKSDVESVKRAREAKIIIGTVITHNKLIIAVKETDKATSPFANEVIILDVAPPGAAAISITPIAISGESGQIITSNSATRGKIIIWEKAPTKKSFGCLVILKKSVTVKPNPKENIIKASAKGRKISDIIPITD